MLSRSQPQGQRVLVIKLILHIYKYIMPINIVDKLLMGQGLFHAVPHPFKIPVSRSKGETTHQHYTYKVTWYLILKDNCFITYNSGYTLFKLFVYRQIEE